MLAACAMSAESPVPRRRGRPRMPTPERHERKLASKRAWRERNLERLHEADRVHRESDAYKARRRAERRARYVPRQRQLPFPRDSWTYNLGYNRLRRLMISLIS
jgi:hypothetical protein